MTVNLIKPDVAAGVLGINGKVMLADSGSFTVLFFDICQLKQVLLLCTA